MANTTDSEKDMWEVKLNFYDKLFESYRKEIDCLWHRSVFLGTFLVLIFTGYGGLVKVWFESFSSNNIFSVGCFPTYKLNIVMLAISFLGVVFSVLWVLMAKGSKAWQEVYEHKIGKFEEALGIRNMLVGTENIEQFEKENDVEVRLLSCVDSENIDPKIFSLNPGSYSVSKINTCLGVVCYMLWFVLFCLHFVYVWTGKPALELNCVVPLVVSVVIIGVVTDILKRCNKGSL